MENSKLSAANRWWARCGKALIQGPRRVCQSRQNLKLLSQSCFTQSDHASTSWIFELIRKEGWPFGGESMSRYLRQVFDGILRFGRVGLSAPKKAFDSCCTPQPGANACPLLSGTTRSDAGRYP